MAVTKVVGFDAPYVGKTFQAAHGALAGADGYLSGAETSDDGVNATIQPYSFLQRGIICSEDVPTMIPVPLAGALWFVVASTVDDDSTSGIDLAVVSDEAAAARGVVIAWKANGTWYSPVPLSTRGSFERDAPETGPEAGFQTSAAINAGVVAAFNLNRGTAVGPDGERRELGGGSAAAPARLAQVAPLPPHALGPRTDYLVLRKREQGTEVVTVMGNALAGAANVNPMLDSGPGVTRPSVYAPRAVGYLRFASAWGNGTNLRLTSTIGGATNTVTSYAGTALIANVWMNTFTSSCGVTTNCGR